MSLLDWTCENSQYYWFPIKRAYPLNVLLESLVWVCFTLCKFVVPDEVQINLTKVKYQFAWRLHWINPVFNVFSLLLITFCKAFQTLSFHLDKEDILRVEEHINERVTKSEVISIFEFRSEIPRLHFNFGNPLGRGFRVKIGSRDLFSFLDHFSH